MWRSMAGVLASIILVGCGNAPEAVGVVVGAQAPAPEPTPQAAGLMVTYAAPEIGTKLMSKSSSRMELDFKATHKGETRNMKVVLEDAVERTTLVTDTRDGAISGARVTYATATRFTEEDGEEKKSLRPVSGREYEVKWQGDDVTVSDASGRKASKEEVDEVKEQSRRLRRYGEFARSLPTTEMMPGASLNLPDAVWKSVVGLDEEGVQIGNVKATLKEIRPHGSAQQGIFAVELSLAGTKDGLGLSANLTGELVVDASTGHLATISFEGPTTLTGSKDGTSITAVGRLALAAETTLAR